MVEEDGFFRHAFRTPIQYPAPVLRIALTGLILGLAWPLCWKTPLVLSLARTYPPETLSSSTRLFVTAFPLLRLLAGLAALAALGSLMVKESRVGTGILVALFLVVAVEYAAVAYTLLHLRLPTIASPIR